MSSCCCAPQHDTSNTVVITKIHRSFPPQTKMVILKKNGEGMTDSDVASASSPSVGATEEVEDVGAMGSECAQHNESSLINEASTPHLPSVETPSAQEESATAAAGVSEEKKDNSEDESTKTNVTEEKKEEPEVKTGEETEHKTDGPEEEKHDAEPAEPGLLFFF